MHGIIDAMLGDLPDNGGPTLTHESLAVSTELAEPKPGLQSQPLAPAAPINFSANLIDAALALELLDDGPDEEAQPLIDESILGELLLPQLGEGELLTRKAPNEVKLKLSEAGSAKAETTDHFWLTDELLESVFS